MMWFSVSVGLIDANIKIHAQAEKILCNLNYIFSKLLRFLL